MLSTLMRSTSAFALTLSLAAPQPLLAQGTGTCPDGSEPVMAEGSDTPVCPEGDGAAEAKPVEQPEAAAEAAEDVPQEDAGAAAEAAEAAEPAAEEAAEAPAQDGAGAETQGAQAEEPGADAAAAAESQDTPVEESAEDAEAQADTHGEAAAETEAQGQPAEAPEDAEAAQAQDSEVESQTDTAAETDVPAAAAEEESAEQETAPAAETAAQTDTPTGAPQGGEAAEQAGDAGTAESGTEAETEDPVEETAEQAESAAEPESEAATETTETPAEEAAQQQAAEAGDPASEEAATETEGAAEVVQEDTAESAADANAPVETEAAAAAGSDTVDPETEVVETVTEEMARSSGEEFESAVQPAEDRDSGLSRFETFALGALGGAAIATLLDRDEEVVMSSQDRLVVRDDQGSYRVLKNDDALLRRPGVEVATREFSDGSTRTVVTRQDGTQVVTIRAADGQVLRRTRILADGREVVLFDDTREIEPVDLASIREVRRQEFVDATDRDALREALAALENPTDRTYSLRQIRQIRAVRELVPEIDLDNVNFETGSAVIRPEEASDLRDIGLVMAEAIDANPNEVFLIEGHTDAVGGAGMNLALSDRRAESVALALTEYFDIPPENMVVQGYGEANLKVRTQEAERANRRVAIRKITPLLYARAD